MSHTYSVQYTDTFCGEANFTWVRRATVVMPDLTHYGYTGSTDGSYAQANKIFNRELMRKAKAAVGLTGVRGETVKIQGGSLEFRPYRSATILLIDYREGD